MTGYNLLPSFNQSTSSTTYAPWVSQGGEDVFKNASQEVAANPAQLYNGPSVASFGPQWGQASDYVSGQLGKTNPTLGSAISYLSNLAGSYDPTKPVSAYMSPYISAALQPTIQAITDQSAKNQQDIGRQAAMAGSYGGTASGVLQALNNRYTQQNIGNATAGAYDAAFKQGQAQKNQDTSNFMSTLAQLIGAGNNQFSEGTSLASILAGLGSTEQQAGQTGINTQLGINRQNATLPLSQYSTLASILGGVPKNSTTTTSGMSMSPQAQGPSSGDQLMAILGGAGGSLMPSFGKFLFGV